MLRNIEDAKVSYLIGYLAGDGNFENGKGKRTNRLSLSTTDIDVVEWIDKNIVEFKKDNPRRSDNKSAGIYARLDAYIKTFPVSFSEEFNKYGVLCLKKNRSICNISKKNMRYWLLGFLDADGCLSYSKRKDRERIAGSISFTHQSFKLLESVQNFLSEELQISSAIKPKKGEDCLVLHFSKIADIIKFGEYLYSNKKDVVLSRKYEKFISFKDEVGSKIEQGFMYPKEFMCTVAYGSIIGSYSKYMFIDAEGIEYPSCNMLAEKYDISKSLVHQRCGQGACGWTRRLKTETEKKEYANYVNRQIKKLFKLWSEQN